MDKVFVENMPKLGFGLMRLPLLDPKDDTSIDIEQVKEMVDTFLERGFTYFDTAWMYHSFKSENAIKEALVDRIPREKYTLATKLHSGFFETLEDRDKVFNQQLEKMTVADMMMFAMMKFQKSKTEGTGMAGVALIVPALWNKLKGEG